MVFEKKTNTSKRIEKKKKKVKGAMKRRGGGDAVGIEWK